MSSHNLPYDDGRVAEAVSGLFGAGALDLLRDDDFATDLESDLGPSLEDLIAGIDQVVQSEAPFSIPTGSDSPRKPAQIVKHVVVRIGATECAIPLARIHEIEREPRTTALPNVPDWVAGITNLRGEILSVIDTRQFLGIPKPSTLSSERLVVVKSNDGAVTTGLLVNGILGVRHVDANDIVPLNERIGGRVDQFLSGVFESHKSRSSRPSKPDANLSQVNDPNLRSIQVQSGETWSERLPAASSRHNLVENPASPDRRADDPALVPVLNLDAILDADSFRNP